MRILYFDCGSGISGDMTVASLLDLGVPIPTVLKGLDALGLDFKVNVYKTQKNGISATKFEIVTDNDVGNTHSHEHRGLNEISSIIEGADLKRSVKDTALKMFSIVAEAEGKIHNKPPREVHFHEVGAVDSIADCVAAAICADYLSPDKVFFSTLREGRGFVKCEHGMIPVPAPATLEIVKAHKINIEICEEYGEMVTPTGAAIAAALGDSFGAPPPAGRIRCAGYGAGTKEFKNPNLLRAILVNTDMPETDKICVIEAAIDDSTGEELGYAMELLLGRGALDVYYTPAYMKKNRPAYLLTALCPVGLERDIVREIFKNTSTIGLRCGYKNRYIMHRRSELVETDFGSIAVKISEYDGIIKRRTEYESARAAAEAYNADIHEVMREAEAVSKRQESEEGK